MIGLEITKPRRLLAEQETLRPNYGKFIAEPLARGFGTTIGNSLRRVLLSSIEGAAIVAVSIDGISHEYDTIEGVREDVVQIILNLKAIRFLVYIEDPITLHLHAEGSGEVTAADITPSGQVEVINPDQHIAHLDRCDSLDIRLRVLRGRGYALAGEPLEDNLAEGVIPIDAKFSPVNKVDFKVEETRVGHITNFDRFEFPGRADYLQQGQVLFIVRLNYVQRITTPIQCFGPQLCFSLMYEVAHGNVSIGQNVARVTNKKSCSVPLRLLTLT